MTCDTAPVRDAHINVSHERRYHFKAAVGKYELIIKTVFLYVQETQMRHAQ